MAKSFNKIKTELDLTDTLPFGKYQGETVFDIAHRDTKYLVWFMENSHQSFADTVQTLINEIEYDTFTNFLQNGQAAYADEDVPF